MLPAVAAGLRTSFYTDDTCTTTADASGFSANQRVESSSIVVPGVCNKPFKDAGKGYASGGMKLMCNQPCFAEQFPIKLRTAESFSCKVGCVQRTALHGGNHVYHV